MIMAGSRRIGWRDVYVARANAKEQVIADPEDAFAIERRMNKLLNTDVGRPRQVNIVKGLKR